MSLIELFASHSAGWLRPKELQWYPKGGLLRGFESNLASSSLGLSSSFQEPKQRWNCNPPLQWNPPFGREARLENHVAANQVGSGLAGIETPRLLLLLLLQGFSSA